MVYYIVNHRLITIGPETSKWWMSLILRYDRKRWEETRPVPANTLQVFITNECNKRCKACFYADGLGKGQVELDDYRRIVTDYAGFVNKVILLGGEPTMHKGLPEMIGVNNNLGLRTTVYTNGYDLPLLEKADLSKTSIRIGVMGWEKSEKPLAEVPPASLPTTIVYMLRKDNVNELMKTAITAERKFNCRAFYISSIRDITETHDYWKDTEETVPMDDYCRIVGDFVNDYEGNIPLLHIARRGVLESISKPTAAAKNCRFGNIFPDGKKIICPLDISLSIYSDELSFGKRACNKNDECLLQKIVLKRI